MAYASEGPERSCLNYAVETACFIKPKMSDISSQKIPPDLAGDGA
jgi:hypothetical protein